MNKLIITFCLLAITGCTGTNPNQHKTDVAWAAGNFHRAFKFAEQPAKDGEPWAQLRLGIFYANGWGVEKDSSKAEYWYQKAAVQKADGWWAEGKKIGLFGKAGYFNQNAYARIAEFNLAQLYYNNDIKLNEALQYINNVIEESEGDSIFFCCEFSGGKYFDPSQFSKLKFKIEHKLNE